MAELLTTADLRAMGLGKNASLTRAGLTRLDRGLYVRDAPTWHTYLEAALHIAGKASGGEVPSVVYGASALALFGLAEQRLPVEVLVAGDVQRRDREWARFVRGTTPRRVLLGLAPPRTSVEDAVLDTVASLARGDACALVTRVLQGRRTTPARLGARLAARVRHRHSKLITDLIDEAAGVESALEYRYVTDVERPHRLPPFTRQFVVPETGHRSDGAYADRRLLPAQCAARVRPSVREFPEKGELAHTECRGRCTLEAATTSAARGGTEASTRAGA